MQPEKILSRIKWSLKVLLGRAKAIPKTDQESKDDRFFCPVCENMVSSFMPLDSYYEEKMDETGFLHSIFQFETLNKLSYSCPICGASDRERLYALYFKKIYDRFDANIKILDIAPSKSLKNYIQKKFHNANYRSADLLMEDVDDQIDITNMAKYKDKTFDFIICSHVLEHIEKDRQAIREIFRVLKNGGKGVVMVPIMLSLTEDYENPNAISVDDRWRHFGQDDHVRLYSKTGFINKIKQASFSVAQYDINTFGKQLFYSCGIHKRSNLYIINK